MAFTDGMLRDGALENKTIIVTGGGTGLGKSMASYFLKLGANVVICSRRLEVLEKTANELTENTGGNVLAIQCDVRQTGQIENVFKHRRTGVKDYRDLYAIFSVQTPSNLHRKTVGA